MFIRIKKESLKLNNFDLRVWELPNLKFEDQNINQGTISEWTSKQPYQIGILYPLLNYSKNVFDPANAIQNLYTVANRPLSSLQFAIVICQWTTTYRYWSISLFISEHTRTYYTHRIV